MDRILFTNISMMNETVEQTRQNVWAMFDRIAPRYDFLNRFLSLRRDVTWRNKLAKFLPGKNNLNILDVATGTADVLISLFRNSSSIKQATGIDLSEKMLEIGRQKLIKSNLDQKVKLLKGDALDIRFAEESFDATTIAFGIRNVTNLDLAIKNLYRVLKKEGRVLILEFSLPGNRLLKKLYLIYFRLLLPKLGSIISGDGHAYRYLNQSVESFPYGESFCKLLRDHGFKNVAFFPLTFGIASIYKGDK